MQPNKVYESLAHLANNIIKNEKLRFELFNQPLFKDQFVKQINNMLALEKDFNQELYGEKWAMIFAKAIVKIIGQKQRFEKPDGRSIEEIYADYSAFISYTTTTFMVGRNELVDDTIKFSEQDVLYSAVLTEASKEHYKNLAAEKARNDQLAKEQTQNPQSQQNNNDNAQPNNNFQQPNQQGPYFGGDFSQQQGFMSMPVHPMQDPRFYPYNAKPKWMPWMKRILAIVAIIGAIMFIVTQAVMMTTQIDFSAKEYGDALFKGHPGWKGSNWDDFLNSDLVDAGMIFPTSRPLVGGNALSFLTYAFYLIPAIYIAYYAFRKPRTLGDKYRLNFWPTFFIILFYGISLSTITSFTSSSNLEIVFAKWFGGFIKNPQDVLPKPEAGWKYDMDGFWSVIMKNYGQEIKSATIVVDVAIGIISSAIILSIVLLIFNPRLDREKVAQANMEFQKAAMAAMQGQSYQMNQALYENDNEIINPKPSKFATWWQKTFKKKKEDKNKDKT